MVQASREPLSQGHCDRLCGIYSAINAIRQVCAPTPIRYQYLFDAAISYLAGKRRLKEVMLHGMSPKLWQQLVGHLVGLHNVRGPRCNLSSLALTDATDDGAAWAKIDEATSRGAVVLVEFTEVRWHFSVICHCDRGRVTLLDSAGSRWLCKEACGFGESARAHRHRIRPESLLCLERLE